MELVDSLPGMEEGSTKKWFSPRTSTPGAVQQALDEVGTRPAVRHDEDEIWISGALRNPGPGVPAQESAHVHVRRHLQAHPGCLRRTRVPGLSIRSGAPPAAAGAACPRTGRGHLPWMRSASVGVRPLTGSGVTSPTVKIPNCIVLIAHLRPASPTRNIVGAVPAAEPSPAAVTRAGQR